MSLQSLAEALVPLADASATQPRSKLHSPFSPLGWLTMWSSEGRETARTDRFLVPDPDLFISPVINFNFSESSNHQTLSVLRTADSPGIALHDGNCEDGQQCISRQSHKEGLTKEEFDYVVNSLLKFLEEAEVASPESECEEYKCDASEDTDHSLGHGLWSPECLMHDSEDEDNLSVAETLVLDEAQRRGSLELVRTSARIVTLLDGDERYPYRFELEFESEGSDNE